VTDPPAPPAPSDPNAPQLEIEVVWKSNEANAPSEIREAIEHLVEVLNRHGLAEQVDVQANCAVHCGVFRVL